MNKQMLTVSEVSSLIKNGDVLHLAGDENLLSQLPDGKWIGGTSANFMTSDGGLVSQDKILVTNITQYAEKIEIKTFTSETLNQLTHSYPENGFVMLIAPGLSDVHKKFAREVQEYDGIFNTPLFGWMSGVHVDELGKRQPKVFAGTSKAIEKDAVAMYVEIPKNLLANLNIVNLFTQGDGIEIEFKDLNFVVSDCIIDGKATNFADYIAENGIDTKLPLVADYNGAMINVAIQVIDDEKKTVQFFAPVFPGVKYKFARPVEDYVQQFNAEMTKNRVGQVAIACNCILNYLYAALEGKKTGDIVGPMTFGEIAYVLLTQTLVYLTVQDKNN